MKRFRFQLDPVLEFKQQLLDSLMVELNAAQARVVAQERAVQEAKQRLVDYDRESNEKKQYGFTIVEALECQACQQVLEKRIKQEEDRLTRVRREAENKRREVVEARKETHSLEKLKEVKRTQYDAAVAKSEEKSLEDLTAARRALATA